MEFQDQVQEQLHLAHAMEQEQLQLQQDHLLLHDQVDLAGGGSETLSNILTIAEQQEAALSYYYTNEDGDIVTCSVYDVSNTDPADIVGDEFFHDVREYDDDGVRPPFVLRGGDRVGDASLDPHEVHQQLLSSGVNPDRFVTAASSSSASSSPAVDRRRLSLGATADREQDEG